MKRDDFMKDIFKWGILAAVVAVAFPEVSFAQTIKDVIEQVQTNELPSIPNILAAGAYIGGAFLGVSGALKLKAHAENPAAEKMAPGIARLIAGGAIAAAPSILNTMRESTHLQGTADFNAWTPRF